MTSSRSPDETEPLPNIDALVDQRVLLLKHLRDPKQRGDLTDAAAGEALAHASVLFDALVGWARDHVIGRTVQGIQSAPYAPGTKRERELGEERPWDDRDLQRAGSEYEFDDPTINKKIIVELTRGASSMLGEQLSSQLSDAFDGLLFGQQYELVRPRKSGLMGPARELWHLRLKACQQVEFLRGTGCSKETALERVSDAYGLNLSEKYAGRERLIKWEQRLTKHFDDFLVTDALETAFNQGTWYNHYISTTDLDEFKQDHLETIENWYGAIAIARDGRRYMAASPI